jgi:8-oxo-dGTP diphosphatase
LTSATKPVERPNPRVGVSLLVIKHGRLLLSRRAGSHGAGEFGTPGGHQENGESYEETALRELGEECGPDLIVTTPRFLCLTNLRRYLPKHYADVGMVTHWVDGEPMVPEAEREKVVGWGWYSLYDLPNPVFGAVHNLVEAYRTGRPFFDE